MSSEVVVVDFWANGFGMRARIALEEKGIEYRYVEEDLSIAERSPLVLEMNPVCKSVPVLIHGRRPICDSLVIVQYIDEAWKVGPTLLPRDPHQGALARFWADFINKKVRKPPPTSSGHVWLRALAGNPRYLHCRVCKEMRTSRFFRNLQKWKPLRLYFLDFGTGSSHGRGRRVPFLQLLP